MRALLILAAAFLILLALVVGFVLGNGLFLKRAGDDVLDDITTSAVHPADSTGAGGGDPTGARRAHSAAAAHPAVVTAARSAVSAASNSAIPV